MSSSAEVVAIEPDEVGEDADRRQAWHTIPRTGGSDGPPDVDFDTWLLHVKFARTGDAAVLEQLVEEYRAYALSLARRLERYRVPFEDLAQVALTSLVAALRRFDPERSVPFVGYAGPSIIGSLKRHYRDFGWAIRVPRRVHEIVGPAHAVADSIAVSEARQASTSEVAERLGIEESELDQIEQAARARASVSLDSPRPYSPDGESDPLPSPDQDIQAAENLIALEQTLDRLTAHQREVLGLYFFADWSQDRIGDHYGVSQMQVSRWIRGALNQLRAVLNS